MMTLCQTSTETYRGKKIGKSVASPKPGDDGYSSCFHTNRGFHPSMSKLLLSLAANFKIDNRIVPWDELISSDTLVNELGHALTRSGWPPRTVEEIRKELLRLHGRWKKQLHKSPEFLKKAVDNPDLWIADSEDEDDIFMPSTRGKSTASSKGKRSASSKGKRYASSKDDDDDFM